MQSLEQLANDFAGWRKRKKSMGEKTPNSLVAAAAALAAVTGDAAVCKATKITKHQLQSYRGGQECRGFTPSCTIVEVPAPRGTAIELTLPSGVRLAVANVELCVALLSALNLGGER